METQRNSEERPHSPRRPVTELTHDVLAEPTAPLISGVLEITIQTRDPRKLASFYTDAFGLVALDSKDDRVWLALGPNARLGLWTPGEKEFGDRGGAHVHFALAVAPSQMESLVRRLQGKGIDLEGPITHDGGDRSIYVRDPEGNVVEAWDLLAHTETVYELKANA